MARTMHFVQMSKILWLVFKGDSGLFFFSKYCQIVQNLSVGSVCVCVSPKLQALVHNILPPRCWKVSLGLGVYVSPLSYVFPNRTLHDDNLLSASYALPV